MGHSPTPWEMHADSGMCEYDVHDAMGSFLFPLPMNLDADDVIDERNESNAAFILAAVNSHADLTRAVADRAALLAACKALVSWMGIPGDPVEIDPEVMGSITAAIRQAESQ